MTEEEAKKAVKEDIEAIAKASEKELAICAMAGLIKTLIDYDKLDEGTVYAMFVKLKMGKDAAEHYVFDGFCF
jgi:hypothetical protein